MSSNFHDFNTAYLDGLRKKIIFQITQELRKKQKQRIRDRVINITVVAHGVITRPLILSSDYYSSSYVTSVTFYQPWGCTLDVTGAYGIMTNHISKDNCKLVMVTENNICINDPPRHWNTLPNDATEVPQVYLSPINHTEKVWKDLAKIAKHYGSNADGFVFEYVNDSGFEQHPPFSSLALLCRIFGAAAAATDATINVRVAACLGWDQKYSHAALMTQYCSVPTAAGDLEHVTLCCDLEKSRSDEDECEDMDWEHVSSDDDECEEMNCD